jgi:predicted nucleotidyltransferase
MKLAENEERALKRLRKELFAKYPIIDFRLYGSKARGEGRPDSDLVNSGDSVHNYCGKKQMLRIKKIFP